MKIQIPNDGKCALGDEEIKLDLKIENRDKRPVRILRFEFTEEVIHTPDMLENDVPLSPDEYYADYFDGRLDYDNQGEIALAEKESKMVPLLFVFPSEDGYYKETARMYWIAEDGDDIEETEYEFTYQIKNDCMKKITGKKYEENTYLFTDYEEIIAGKKVKVKAIEGFATSVIGEVDPSKIDYAIVDDSEGVTSKPTIVNTQSIRAGSVLNLTYCLRLRFYDQYKEAPSSSDLPWWRPRGDNNLHNFLGLEVQLWDRDGGSSSDDDYIKSVWLYNSADGNYFCTSFSWDQYANGESYPDVYIKTRYRVKDTTHSQVFHTDAGICALMTTIIAQ